MDKQIFFEFNNGDKEALGKLVELYSDGLMLYINNFVKDINIAEDLMEDTFAKLLFKKCNFKGDSSFKTYLYKMGRNCALDYIKKNKKRITENIDDKDIADTIQIENIVIKSDYQKQVHTCLKKLNNEYTEVLHLIYFEDLKYEEIQKVMKKTNKQIKNLAYRARQALKVELEREGFVYEEI
ncbi:MAG: RNA polymerase sigma factor [Clostridiales bacterium]|nr:RNA polymerase sigma factor [Clostridiales bacterium]